MRNSSVFGLIGWIFLLTAFRQSENKPIKLVNDNRLLAATWFALSAENQACYLQTYRMAAMQLDHNSGKQQTKQKLAIVTDLDETVLDNSPWTIKVLQEGTDYPSYWSDWEKAGIAPAFPGAVDFFKKATLKGIEVYYISNRAQENLGSTIKNLKDLGLPNADSNHVFLKTTESNKVARRDKVLKTNRKIVMLLGDNLADFDGVWEKAPLDKRAQSVTDHTADWGTRFIIFPNPVYGSWKEGLFEYKRGLSDVQEDSIWKVKLTEYQAKYKF